MWRAFGDQGDTWTMARLSIPADVAVRGYQVNGVLYTEWNWNSGNVSSRAAAAAAVVVVMVVVMALVVAAFTTAE